VPPLALYNALIAVAALVAAPFAGLVSLVRPAWRRGLAARFGIGWPTLAGGDVLWAHAASVGEVEGIAPLVRCWRDAHPAGTVVFSSLTATGCDAARRLLPDAIVRTFPFDFAWIVRAVVRRVRPTLFVFSENEVWPNVISTLSRAGVPIVQVSGRLSERAARLLARIPRLAREVLCRVTRFCVQGHEHRERLVALGVPGDRIVVTGSLKGVDRVAQQAAFVPALAALARPVIVAGSTHPGEESAVVEAASGVAGARRPFLVIAPRHPERFAQVATLLERRGVAFVRRSTLPGEGSPSALAAALAPHDALLLDTLGELAGCYAAADVAFVGGTLVPVGGHNVLEAARAGAPVIVGPHHANVARVVARLEAEGAAAVARDARDLASALGRFLASDAAAERRAAARAIAAGEAGGLAATWAVLAEVTAIATSPSDVEPGGRAAAPAPPSARLA